MSTALVNAARPTVYTTHSRLLSLPYELRLEIYETHLWTYFYDKIYDDTVVDPWIGREAVQFLEVCKQIYEEASPIVFRRMHITGHYYEWKKFLETIGQRNLAKVQHLKIKSSCNPDGQECDGHLEKEESHWPDIFRLFKMCQPQSRLKTLEVYMNPCSGSRNETSPHSLQYTKCHVYNDLAFLKNLSSSFGGVQQIVLSDKFNPLWGSFLRRRLGFVVMRRGVAYQTFVNPNHPCFDIDTRGYEKSIKYDDVYDEVVKEPEPESEPSEVDEDPDAWEQNQPEEWIYDGDEDIDPETFNKESAILAWGDGGEIPE
ncbi:hypothetical protein F4805DRAFT_472344 [Annulohypoxylon moriforme]|nr:hypothetical protein F4805DRAFT_472344 [Annulohypoxylon moriforme]